MKNYPQIVCLFLLIATTLTAQQEKGITGSNNWLNSWTEFRPNLIQHDKPTQILTGDISEDTKLYKRDIYLLLGSVFVTDSTTLTIEPGTVIIGDFKTNGSLTISNGSTIIADGLETDPIIFTSSKSVKRPGDWGGLFILGDAPINSLGKTSTINYGLNSSSNNNILYGGENRESNSGILRYVRIEYAGKRTVDYGYYNGLTLAGIGSETIIDNVMVSYCGGNSFNVLGGDTNLSKMVSYRSSSNDYKFSWGAQSNMYNSLAIRSPYVSGSNGGKAMYVNSFENKVTADVTKPGTIVNAKNLTLINVSDDLASDIEVGLVKEGLYIGEGASLLMETSVISGFNPAVILDNKIQINNENLEKIKFSEMYFNNCNGNIFTKNNPNNEDLENWYGNRAFNNVYSKGSDKETFIDSKSMKRPDFRLQINKIIATTRND